MADKKKKAVQKPDASPKGKAASRGEADFLDRVINYIQQNKKKCIIISSVVGAILLAVIIVSVAVLIITGNKPPEKVSDLVDRMADLVNEPASDMDEPYTDGSNRKAKPEYMIRVNKTRNCITIYNAGKNGEYGDPVRAMVCSVGFDAPEGVFQTSDRYTWKIVNGNVWSQYATRITGNVLFHSVTYSQKDKSTLINRYFNQLGTNASTGSIRVMAADAKWLMENCVPGTQVEIYKDNDPGPLGKPPTIALSGTTGWDPSDPDPANPWINSTADIQGVSDKTVERGIEFDFLQGITATDTVGNNAIEQVAVDTDLDLKKLGKYTVTYTLTDGVGHTCRREAAYTVVDTTAPYFSGIKSVLHVKKGDVVTAESLLADVAIVDNNEILSKDKVKVELPELVEGDNIVIFRVADDYGNERTAQTLIKVDVEPPVLHLREGISGILDPNQQVDEGFALSRVYATDSGVEMPQNHIQVQIYQDDWGYTFVYTATDDSGQSVTLTDTVSYPTYSISASATMNVTSLDNAALLQGVSVMDGSHNVVAGATPGIVVQPVSANTYRVTYSYVYSCVLGTRTATAERIVTLTGAAAQTETPPPSAGPASPGPGATPAPGMTAAPPSAEPTEEPEPTEAVMTPPPAIPGEEDDTVH